MTPADTPRLRFTRALRAPRALACLALLLSGKRFDVACVARKGPAWKRLTSRP